MTDSYRIILVAGSIRTEHVINTRFDPLVQFKLDHKARTISLPNIAAIHSLIYDMFREFGMIPMDLTMTVVHISNGTIIDRYRIAEFTKENNQEAKVLIKTEDLKLQQIVDSMNCVRNGVTRTCFLYVDYDDYLVDMRGKCDSWLIISSHFTCCHLHNAQFLMMQDIGNPPATVDELFACSLNLQLDRFAKVQLSEYRLIYVEMPFNDFTSEQAVAELTTNAQPDDIVRLLPNGEFTIFRKIDQVNPKSTANICILDDLFTYVRYGRMAKIEHIEAQEFITTRNITKINLTMRFFLNIDESDEQTRYYHRGRFYKLERKHSLRLVDDGSYDEAVAAIEKVHPLTNKRVDIVCSLRHAFDI